MSSFGSDYKYTLAYTASTPSEVSARSIAGLNVSGSTSTPEVGPTNITVVNKLYSALSTLSNGQISNGRWITERSVTF